MVILILACIELVGHLNKYKYITSEVQAIYFDLLLEVLPKKLFGIITCLSNVSGKIFTITQIILTYVYS